MGSGGRLGYLEALPLLSVSSHLNFWWPLNLNLSDP